MYAEDITNTSKKTSSSLLMEVTCHHMAQMSQKSEFNFQAGLVHGKTPSAQLGAQLVDGLKLEAGDGIRVGLESRLSHLATCAVGDVVLFEEANENFRVGKVQLHCEIEGVPITLVSTFDLQSHNSSCGHSLWKQRANANKYIGASRILHTVVYMQLPADVVVINLPFEYREFL